MNRNPGLTSSLLKTHGVFAQYSARFIDCSLGLLGVAVPVDRNDIPLAGETSVTLTGGAVVSDGRRVRIAMT